VLLLLLGICGEVIRVDLNQDSAMLMWRQI
jgi:hypothetical protein